MSDGVTIAIVPPELHKEVVLVVLDQNHTQTQLETLLGGPFVTRKAKTRFGVCHCPEPTTGAAMNCFPDTIWESGPEDAPVFGVIALTRGHSSGPGLASDDVDTLRSMSDYTIKGPVAYSEYVSKAMLLDSLTEVGSDVPLYKRPKTGDIQLRQLCHMIGKRVRLNVQPSPVELEGLVTGDASQLFIGSHSLRPFYGAPYQGASRVLLQTSSVPCVLKQLELPKEEVKVEQVPSEQYIVLMRSNPSSTWYHGPPTITQFVCLAKDFETAQKMMAATGVHEGSESRQNKRAKRALSEYTMHFPKLSAIPRFAVVDKFGCFDGFDDSAEKHEHSRKIPLVEDQGVWKLDPSKAIAPKKVDTALY